MYHINKSIENLERVFDQNTCREKQITLLVDEAYHYFYPRTFIKYALENKRVFITRTFSKLFAKKIITTLGILDKLIKEFIERQTNNYACTK